MTLFYHSFKKKLIEVTKDHEPPKGPTFDEQWTDDGEPVSENAFLRTSLLNLLMNVRRNRQKLHFG